METFSKSSRVGAQTLDCQKVSWYIFPFSCVCFSPSVWFISSDFFSPTLAPSSSPVSLLLKVVPSSCWNHTKKVFPEKSNRCSKELSIRNTNSFLGKSAILQLPGTFPPPFISLRTPFYQLEKECRRRPLQCYRRFRLLCLLPSTCTL